MGIPEEIVTMLGLWEGMGQSEMAQRLARLHACHQPKNRGLRLLCAINLACLDGVAGEAAHELVDIEGLPMNPTDPTTKAKLMAAYPPPHRADRLEAPNSIFPRPPRTPAIHPSVENQTFRNKLWDINTAKRHKT